MTNKPIHIHKNIVDRNLNIFLLFLPAFIFVLFLTIMFSFYKIGQHPREDNETILGEKENIDDMIKLNNPSK
ncbi:hypothetical protein KKH23_00950 [Patescibacteria group bacterium]|nr:hypothetical protein [Patescibacteria group bacterium]MBU0777060.1 hypothetical protein [Patescibacteria group bacterium]MBU0845754.1 hypothetical protein [Patescibacteria group bacterium]MBU0923196.1 hypothetical protein [Patescibacteria group bacterium]MBU1066486.1 hypothetical protein [Patescibacteria group bacterium]